MKFSLSAIAIASRLHSSLKPLPLLRSLLILFLMGCLTFIPMPQAYAQTQPQLLKLTKDNGQPQALTTEELAQLNDPLFNLVLKDHVDTQTVEGIRNRLQPTLGEQQGTFVVHERIADDAQQVNGLNASRRSVITFNSQAQFSPETNRLELPPDNVMLSVFFNPNSFPSAKDIEAMAWDDDAGEFNYYKLNQVSGETEPTWKFRGNSKDADLLSVSERQGTCMACHINGSMVMKEFKAPWNNWDSADFQPSYLRTGNSNSWPTAKAFDNGNRFGGPDGAQRLENTVLVANQRFNQRQIDELRDGNQITDAKRLLKPLFVTTEFSLMSSFSESGLHPFGNAQRRGGIDIPISFLANSDLLSEFGIFPSIQANLSRREYENVVQQASTTLAGRTPGDTHFAWLTPESSNIDVTYVQELIDQNIVPREFVAAALSVDLENPVLSSDREQLWSNPNLLPTQFQTGPNNNLTAETIRRLEQLNPSANSPEGQFLAALRSPDPIAFLRTKVEDYTNLENRRLGNRQVRPQEIGRLYRNLLELRQRVDADEVLHTLNESSLLFPTGNIAALPDSVDDIATPNRPTLAQGDQGRAVQELQEILQALGFLNGAADGDFGPMTEQAVTVAQRNLGLVADGIVGPATWDAFDRVFALPILRMGAQGDDVVLLQERLQALNVLNGFPDGDFGPITERAVITLQSQFGLEADGIVGPATWARIIA